MRLHGFARGGPIILDFRAPDFYDNRSDYHVDVRITNFEILSRPRGFFTEFGQKSQEEKALGWVLEALMLYPTELGLSDHPWNGKHTSRRKKATEEVDQ